MIETHLSKDFVYLCLLYNTYIALKDNEEKVEFKPLSIKWNKELEMYEFKLDVINLEEKKNDEIVEGSGFGKIE